MVPAPSRSLPRPLTPLVEYEALLELPTSCHGVPFDEISVIEYAPQGGNGIRAKYLNDAHCEYDEVLTWGHFETSYKK